MHIITETVRQPDGEVLLFVRRHGGEVLSLDVAEARALLGELAAELLALDGRPIGQRLGDLLDNLADGLRRRQLPDVPIVPGVDGYPLGDEQRRHVAELGERIARKIGDES